MRELSTTKNCTYTTTTTTYKKCLLMNQNIRFLGDPIITIHYGKEILSQALANPFEYEVQKLVDVDTC